MALVSLKKYLYDDNGFLPVLDTVFQDLIYGAVRVDNGEYTGLAAELQRLKAKLDGQFSAENALTAVNAGMQAVQEYNRRATQFVRRQGQELQNIMAMMADALIAVSGSSQQTTEALSEIETTLKQADAIRDLEELKSRIGVCLEQVRQEAARNKMETAATLAKLEGQMQAAQTRGQFTDFDPVTDLPGRRSAEGAMRQAMEGGGRHYLGVFVLRHLRSINVRFGNAVGDQVIVELARLLRVETRGETQLFRWSGPTLVVLVSRHCPVELVRADFNRIMNQAAEKEFRTRGHTAYIPIAPTWTILGLAPPLETMAKQVDVFVARQVPEEGTAGPQGAIEVIT